MDELELTRRAMIHIRNTTVQSQHESRHSHDMPNIHPETKAILNKVINTYDEIIRQCDHDIEKLDNAIALGKSLQKGN